MPIFSRAVKPQETLEAVTRELQAQLGGNLHSLVAFGSVVRGNFNPKTSDVNLLMILNEPSVAAHQAIKKTLTRFPAVDPFILEKRGLDRTMKVFALKFKSIRRNHKLLAGQDPFDSHPIDDNLSKLLCEQALRNQLLRLTHDFVMLNPQVFARRLGAVATGVFVNVSELARLQGENLPNDFSARITILCRVLDVPAAFLQELLDLKEKPSTVSEELAVRIYGDVLTLLSHAIRWTEANWKLQ